LSDGYALVGCTPWQLAGWSVEEKQCHFPKEGRLSAMVYWVKEEA
jgi:hypothetical protein